MGSSSSSTKSSAWITARFDASDFPDEFYLGGRMNPVVGGYFNRPLEPSTSYRVFVRAVGATNVSLSINQSINQSM